jgi:hypothetical protein
MNELTFITLEGITKTHIIPNNIKLNYKYLISSIRKELIVKSDLRIKVFLEGHEDALNPSSDIQPNNKYFALFQQINVIKTKELIHFIINNTIIQGPYNCEVSELNMLDIYINIEELINDGANIKYICNTNKMRCIMIYIIRYNDIKLLKLLLNNGLDINSSIIKEHIINTCFTRHNITDILLLYKIDLKYHYDLNCSKSITKFTHNHRLLSHAMSENILDLNTLVPPNNTALFYYVHNLDKFIQKYKYTNTIDYNLRSPNGDTYLSMDIFYGNKCLLDERLNHYPQIDINLQYRLKKKSKYIQDGDTLLHMLCRNNNIHYSKIQLLLNRDAKLIKNDSGETQIDVLEKRMYNTKRQQQLIIYCKKYL